VGWEISKEGIKKKKVVGSSSVLKRREEKNTRKRGGKSQGYGQLGTGSEKKDEAVIFMLIVQQILERSLRKAWGVGGATALERGAKKC